MTDAMLEKAWGNADAAGMAHVRFRKGTSQRLLSVG